VKNNPAERQEVERVRSLVQQDLDELQKSIANRTAAGHEVAFAEILTDRARKLTEALRQSITGIGEEQEGTLARLARQRRVRLSSALAVVSGALLLAAAYLFIGQVIIARSASRRQMSEEALRASERRFKALCEQAPVGIYSTDAQGACIYTNPQWSQMSGLSAADSLGHGWKKALHPDDRETVFENWKTNALQGVSWEYRLLTPERKIRWIRALGGPIYSDRGELTGYIGTVDDITELKRAQDSVQEALEQLQLITDNMSAGVVHVSSDLRYVWVNPNYAALIGRAKEEVTGRRIIDVIGKEVYEDVRPYIEKVLRGERGEVEIQVTLPEAGRRWVHAVYVPTTGQGHNIDGYISVIADVTERHEAEERLGESEERFRNMADTAPVLIWGSGLDKGCTFFNKVWLDFTGRTLEQELGNGWTEGVHPEDLEHCLAVYSSAFDARQSFQMEYRLRRADGTHRWLLGSGVPRFTAGNVFHGYIGSCIDITERIRAEEERQKFVSLADTSLDFIGMCDRDFRVFYVNAAGMRLVGLDNLEEACRGTVQDYVFPEDQSFITN
jgi:PAS domain S-box-containing protein